MTNCRDIDRHKFQWLPVPEEAEKVKNGKGLDDFGCNIMVPSMRGATRTVAIGL